ncbi:MAG: type II toxin-antitoxin system ParD family antitoxin [Alphaproteobacteria bacterium]|nr:type II toxin-antitoxin system ParD family antitoxin [Alphaproteobacteria bacterium]
MDIALPPQVAQMVRAHVASGKYHSAEEVIHMAVRLLADHEAIQSQQLKALRTDIDKGLKSGKPVHVSEKDFVQTLSSAPRSSGKRRRS